jgi:ribosomal protein L11 methylase PrmA
MNIRNIIANELFRTLKHELIRGCRVLDVGTRSGENAIMMLNDIGAKSVTAIDVDDTEFPFTKHGVQFEKMSLQEHNTSYKYDIITVFLWNVSINQYNSFIESIKQVLKTHNSTLIIGIYDEDYIKDKFLSVPNLLWNHGFSVSQKEFSGCWNRYILYCHRIK